MFVNRYCLDDEDVDDVVRELRDLHILGFGFKVFMAFVCEHDACCVFFVTATTSLVTSWLLLLVHGSI